MIDVLQSAAADAGFGETRGTGVEGGQTLVQAKVCGRLRQGRRQRAQGLGRHVVRNKEFGIGERGANRESDGIGIMLVDGGSGCFQFVDDDGGFFRGNDTGGGIAADLADHLLVVVQVERVARLHGREALIQVAGAGEVAGLH